MAGLVLGLEWSSTRPVVTEACRWRGTNSGMSRGFRIVSGFRVGKIYVGGSGTGSSLVLDAGTCADAPSLQWSPDNGHWDVPEPDGLSAQTSDACDGDNGSAVA